MPLKTHVDEIPNINMTSMIDIALLLTIFFMAATKFAEMDRKIELQVPHVADRGALPAASEKKTVNVYRDGVVTLDGITVTLDELIAKLTDAHRHSAALGVMVRGDGAGNFQRVAEVLNACKQAGVAELAISVQVDAATR
ncbi:MAG TPA: biopolymer transporter ExbD [Pirellulales bacterium]